MDIADAIAACRAEGHDWPYQPSIFRSNHQVGAEPSTDTCARCGCVRTIKADNSRTYSFRIAS